MDGDKLCKTDANRSLKIIQVTEFTEAKLGSSIRRMDPICPSCVWMKRWINMYAERDKERQGQVGRQNRDRQTPVRVPGLGAGTLTYGAILLGVSNRGSF